MILLKTLGALDLIDSGGREITGILTQPKRVALLTYLALANPKGTNRRDTILALFWPESDQERARNSLRQAVHHLRRQLGEGVLVNRGDEELGLAPGRFHCDAAEFDRAMADGDVASALEWYRGDLLPGFFLSDAPEFERWLESERMRLRGLAARAAWARAEAEAPADPSAAIAWGRKAVAFAPDDEGGLRRLIGLLDQAGDRAGAVRGYEEFALYLAREFNVEPSAETQELIRAVRSRAAPIDSGPRAATPQSAPGGFSPIAVPPAAETPLPARAGFSRRSRLATIVAGILVAAFIIGGTWPLWHSRGVPAEAVDPDLVVVLPFRISGADPSLGYLREGMLDLLAAKLTGEGGLRAGDPRTVMGLWRQMGAAPDADLPTDDAIKLARRLGGGRLLFGGIVGRPDRLVITASVLRVPGGETRARASVEGPADSLPEMIDRLTGQLLSRAAGEEEQRVPLLAGASLQALRAYLEGQAASRRGEYATAVLKYQDAVELDSTLLPAAVGLAASGIWYPTDEAARQRGIALAWRGRDRLSAGDRAVLLALAGPAYPAVSSWKDRLDAWEQAVKAAPGRPEAWYEFGDILLHRGPVLGMVGSRDLAAAAFSRALALDSSFAAAISHLLEVAAASGDGAQAGRLARLFLSRDSTSELADFVRWRAAVANGDQPALAGLRRRMDAMAVGSLWRIIGTAQLDGTHLDDAEQAAAVLVQRPATRLDQYETASFLMELALNRGRTGEARRRADALRDGDPNPEGYLVAHILNALYSDGDSAAATSAVETLRREDGAALPAEPAPRAHRLWGTCALEQWKLWHGEAGRAEETIARLRNARTPDVPPWGVPNFSKCAFILDAILAVTRRSPEAAVKVARLDSLMLTAPEADGREPGNFVVARLKEMLGDRPGALVAIRRRQYHSRGGLPFLSTMLREEGRLASLTGDRTGAVAAWHHYLALRSSPEPGLAAQAAMIREELSRLEQAQ